ncbi:hypothetical protein AWN76_005405 [Rhodothermaceae bacterium RA]|nr:hypothetical protein AWN76_005405 [Rhodothermaceae bacterium RA]
MSVSHLVGIILVVLGVLAAVFPSWFGPLTGGPEPPADVFEAVERRVRGGMVLGLGLCFLALSALRPWSMSIPTVLFYLMAGALAARLLGLLVDGAVPRQWLMVAIETGVMTAAALWLWRTSGPAP